MKPVALKMSLLIAFVLRAQFGFADGLACWGANNLGTTGPNYAFSLGYRFKATNTLQATHLGRVDYDGGGLAVAALARLYDWGSGAALASVTIPAGMAGRETNGLLAVHYAALTNPVTLYAGSNYLVAVEVTGLDFGYAVNATLAPGVQWIEGRATPVGAPAMPAVANGTTFSIARSSDAPPNYAGYLGASFKFTLTVPPAGNLAITAPVSRSVRQRDRTNYGDLTVRGQCGTNITRLEVQATPRSGYSGTATNWQVLDSAPTNGNFHGQLRLKGGWYDLSVIAYAGSTAVATGMVQRVGVGEVFVTAGQSNAANYGQPGLNAMDDRVSAGDLSGNWVHADAPMPVAAGTGGSPWPPFGDALAGLLDVPVGIIAVAVGSTQVGQWVPGAAYYYLLKNALQLLGTNGCRAVLWHQGESDSIAGTSASSYAQQLQSIISQSRQDAGFDVPWGVAIASYHPSATSATEAPVQAGQWMVITNTPGVYLGAQTDPFHLTGYLYDTVHFNTNGLKAHGAQWAQAVRTNAFPKPQSSLRLSIQPTALNAFGLRWNVDPGLTCQLQCATNLAAAPASWTAIGDWLFASTTNLSATVTPAVTRGGFFRVMLPHTDY
jgi:hypothetical protein